MLVVSILHRLLVIAASFVTSHALGNRDGVIHTVNSLEGDMTTPPLSSALGINQQGAADASGYDSDDDHLFTFKEFAPKADGKGSNLQPYFRFLMFFKKKPNITEERYHRHWKTIHADLTIASRDVGVNILHYVQFHQDSYHKKLISPFLGNGISYAPYDGIAEFHAKDFPHFQRFLSAAFTDPVIHTDESKFVDTAWGLHVMAGYDNLIFGRAIAQSGATDGICADDNRLNYTMVYH